MAIKLICAFGVVEIIGLVQITGSNESELLSRYIINLLHSICRNIRGFLIFIVYIMKQAVWEMLTRKIERRRELMTASSTNDDTRVNQICTTSVM